MSRRTLLGAIGAGAGAAALSGTAAGTTQHGDGGLDDVYGRMYAAGQTVPSDAYDHTVELHTHGHGEDGAHAGFPMPDDARGPAPDPDSADDVPEFHFEPSGLLVEPGDVVRFVAETSLHTVTAYHPKFNEPPFLQFPKRIPREEGYTSSIMAAGDSWLFQFDTTGVHDILCLPHERLGMVMRVVVAGPDDDPSEFTVPSEQPSPNAGRVLGDDRLAPGTIANSGPISWDELSLSGPGTAPRPSVDSFVLRPSQGSNVFVRWEVSDPTDLDTLQLTLRNTTRGGPGGEPEDVGYALLGGTSDDGLHVLDSFGPKPNWENYEVELVVSGSGPSTTVSKPVAGGSGN